MRKELSTEIEIPEGIEVTIEKGKVTIKGPEGENQREFNINNFDLEKKDNKIIMGNKKSTKMEKKMMNTTASHIKNMIKGVQEKFNYKLKICFSHFPFTVEIKGNEAIIKNFLGEKKNRICVFPKGVDVKVDKQIIEISSTNKELAGQASANFETATKVRKRDRRVFQDGIYIIDKNGRAI